jgi:inositol-pentakisphosphate 2-kinase
VSGDTEVRRKVVERLTEDVEVREYLVGNAQALLQKLRSAQMEMDRGGVLAIGEKRLGLCKAMTLRDCTLFVRRVGREIEAKLGDLDLKQPEKIEKWKEVERVLIDGGWYANTEREDLWTRESVCLLSEP